MPISQINPDGTVKIVNSNTGQVLDVKPEELPKYNPKLVMDYQAKLQEQQAASVAAQQVQSGQLKLSDIPENQKVKVASQLTKAGYQPEQKAKNDTLGAVNNLINNLEKNYQAAGGGEVNAPILAGLVGAGKDIGGKLGFNDSAETYNREKEGFAATLKGLTGDTGVLTDQDFQRLSKLLPGLGSKPEVAKNLLNDLRSQVAAKYGGKASQTTVNPKSKGLLDILIPNTKNIAQDVGSGIEANLTEGARNQSTQQSESIASGLEQEAMQAKDMNQRKALLGQANQVRQGIINTSQKTANSFSEDVNQNPIIRSILGATEIGTTMEAPGAAKGGLSFLKNILSKLSTSGATAAREAAAKGITVNTKPLIEAGDNYVRSIDPAAQKAWDTLKPAIQESTSVPDLLQKLTNWGDKAFTKSGDKRAITEGLLKSHLYQAGREVIKKEAPEVAKYTKDIAKGMGRKKVLDKAGSLAGAAAVTGTSYALLSKLLGQNAN